jgi:hypothetical protein
MSERQGLLAALRRVLFGPVAEIETETEDWGPQCERQGSQPWDHPFYVGISRRDANGHYEAGYQAWDGEFRPLDDWPEGIDRPADVDEQSSSEE